jgi:hypothetical protein
VNPHQPVADYHSVATTSIQIWCILSPTIICVHGICTYYVCDHKHAFRLCTLTMFFRLIMKSNDDCFIYDLFQHLHIVCTIYYVMVVVIVINLHYVAIRKTNVCFLSNGGNDFS